MKWRKNILQMLGCYLGVVAYLIIYRSYFNIILESYTFDEEETKIPKVLWFTYKNDLLVTKEPRHYYENVMKTINTYQELWGDPTASARVLDNRACIDIIEKVDHQLAIAFMKEEKSKRRNDLCRLAALYLYGGYYFELDMEVVTPILFSSDISFSAAYDFEEKFFIDSFMASSPSHPILKNYIKVMVEYYYEVENSYCKQLEDEKMIGPCMVWSSYNMTEDSNRGSNMFLKEEHGLNGDTDRCGYDVVNPSNDTVYFHAINRRESNCIGIPKFIWFSYKDDILATKSPKHYYRNIKNTLAFYQDAWADTNIQARVLDDPSCITFLQDKNNLPQNITSFKPVIEGKYDVDLCRLVVLYNYGGYIFDLDLEPISPILLPHNTSFAAVKNDKYFSKSFFAVTPKHPIFELYLNLTIEHISNSKNSPCYSLSENENIDDDCLLWESFSQTDEDALGEIVIFEKKSSTDYLGRSTYDIMDNETKLFQKSRNSGWLSFLSRKER